MRGPAAALLLAAATLLAAPAAAQDEAPARVMAVKEATEFGTTVLVDRGTNHGVRAGQTVEVQRAGRAIGYGSVDTAFPDISVVTVGTVAGEAGPLRAGDGVVIRPGDFAGPGAGGEGPAPGGLAGRVVGIHDGVVLVDLGRLAGIVPGQELSIRAGGRERGRVVIELVNGATSGGLLVRGEARPGDVAVLVGEREPERIDFGALSVLGVVADVEHPTPHRASCHVGVPVRRIIPASPAERAGIAAGDRVIAVDGGVVRDVAGIRQRVEARRGPLVRVHLLRGELLLEVRVAFE